MIPRLGHPKIFFIPTNSISKDNPIITSGITNGEVIDPTNKLFPLNLPNLVIIIAAIVPRIMEIVAEIPATFKLVHVACKMILLEINSRYHFSEKPPHVLRYRDSLKE